MLEYNIMSMNTSNTILPILGSVEFRPASEGVYPVDRRLPYDMDLPPYYREGTDAYSAAISYVRTILPDIEAKPFSNAGRTAVVLHDGTYAYKVFRERSHGYNLVENETAALEMLGREGVAPRPVALIDAALEHRYQNPHLHHRAPLFGGNLEIPRVASSGHLPVIVTELQDVGPITELPAEKLVGEFDRFALAALKHRLLFEDCEFLHDRRTEQAIVIDVGEVFHVEEDSGEGEAENLANGRLVQSALIRFGRGGSWPRVAEFAPASYPNTLADLHPVLHAYCGRSSL